MRFKILFDKLPEIPTVERAVYRAPNGEILFGTLYTASKEGVRSGVTSCPGGTFAALDRDGYSFFYEEPPRLPYGWRAASGVVEDEGAFCGTFVTYCLEVPMKIDAFEENGGRVPAEVGLLLAAHLQLGWKLNAVNFDLFRCVTGQKFLPFVITPTGLRYYMYRPSAETMQMAIAQFVKVLARLEHLMEVKHLNLILEYAYAAALVSRAFGILEAGDVAQDLGASYSKVSTAVYSMMAIDDCPIGFVYQDLKPGPHDAYRFTADMFIQKRR